MGHWGIHQTVVRERENGVKASSHCSALRFLSRLLECLGAEATCWVSFHLPEAALLWCPCLAKPCTRNGPWEARQLFLAPEAPCQLEDSKAHPCGSHTVVSFQGEGAAIAKALVGRIMLPTCNSR